MEKIVFLRMSFPVLSGQAGGQAGGQAEKITERQKEIFELIKADSGISMKQLSDKLGINQSAIQKHTDALKKKGLIHGE